MLHGVRAIRPMTVAIIKNKQGHILVSPGYDKKIDHYFYRLLGGGIDFGETSEAALKREFQEELEADLINCRLLKVTENIFSFEGQAGHEICFIYEAEFADASLYEQKEFKILDSSEEGTVIWLDLAQRQNRPIYPDIEDLLK